METRFFSILNKGSFILLFFALLFEACKPTSVSPSAKAHALLKQKTLYKTIASTQAIGKYEYEYDQAGRLTKVVDNGTSSTSAFSYYTLTYNADGTIDKRQVYVSDAQQTNGYSLSTTYSYVYQSGQLAYINGNVGMFELFNYTNNKLSLLNIFNADGSAITDNVTFQYDQLGTLIKRSHTVVGVGLVDYAVYNYTDGKLSNEALNTNGQDSSIIFEYRGTSVSKVTYFDQFKETRRVQIFSFDDAGNVVLEIFNDYPKMGQDSTHITKYEYYP